MAFQVSPGVQVNEIDATSVIPAVSTSIGGFAGAFNWGPVNKPVLVSSEDAMATVFSTPNEDTAPYFLTAASFLKYGNALKVVRVAGAAATNAVSGSTAVAINNHEEFTATMTGTAPLTEANQGSWAARYPGVLGNSIKVYAVSNATAMGTTAFDSYRSLFGAPPSTSDFAKKYHSADMHDEMHVVVVDEDGLITGTKGTILETYEFLSKAEDAVDAAGASTYVPNVINAKSEYVYFIDWSDTLEGGGKLNPANTSSAITAYAASDTVYSAALTGGVDANSAIGHSVITAGFDKFADSDIEDVNLLFAYPDATDAKNIAEHIITLCETRKDCMAFVSPPIGNATTPALAKSWVDSLNSSSYGAADSASVYVYDKFHDVYRWIGASGLCAGLCANTDSVADAWFSPAGVNRGQLRGVTRLSYNPTKAERDMLYKARVNPLVSFPGQGTMLFGDKTLLSRASAFDRINVRRLFIVLEKAISTASKAQLFEFNDEFTQAQFRNMIEPFLRDVKGRRGLTDFLVVCDESNNTGQVIDSNQFVADIYIKPARSINFITLNFIATRTGVDFSEVAGG